MRIQVTEIQKGKFCMTIHGIECIFMPMSLFTDKSFLPLPAKVKGSTLGWYVKRKFVSYNQIKKAIKNKK